MIVRGPFVEEVHLRNPYYENKSSAASAAAGLMLQQLPGKFFLSAKHFLICSTLFPKYQLGQIQVTPAFLLPLRPQAGNAEPILYHVENSPGWY